MNKLILKFISLFRPLFERFDVDTEQLLIILSVKLKMDDRRPNAFMAGRQNQKKVHNNSSVLAMVLLAVMGCILIFPLAFEEKSFTGHIIYFSVFMVFISLTLISDFTNVLIDVRDNFIILPRPVSDRTITVSRILHITIHVSKLIAALLLPGLIFLIYKNGAIAGSAFFIEGFSASLFTIFFVNIIYLVVLKVSSPQRFKDFISYFQIILSVSIFAAYQMLPRLIGSAFFQDLDILSYKLSYLFPPVWLASFYDILVYPEHFSLLKLLLAVLGILMPFITIIIVIKVLAPGFNQKLSSIGTSGSDPVSPNTPVTPKNPTGLAQRLSSVLAKDSIEQAGFRLTWWLTSRYRDFRIKVYPSFAYVPVYFAYFFFVRGGRGRQEYTLEAFRNGNSYMFLMYLTGFMIFTVLQQVTQSERYKSAWIMFATPHNKPGLILAGTFKALIVKFFVPYYLIISVFSLVLWGAPVLNDLLFAFFNILTTGLILALFTVKYLPFSQPVNTKEQGGRAFINLAIMMLLGLLGFIHYALSRWEWLIWALVIVSAGLCMIIFYYFKTRDWEALEADYD